MKNNEEQKNRELLFLTMFKKLWVDFPDGKIICHEKPDFLIDTQEKIIGIELTELYWEQEDSQTYPKQAQESDQWFVAKLATAIHESSNLPDCHVSISFSDNNTFRKKDAQSIASHIFNLVRVNIPNKGIYISSNSDDLNINTKPPYIIDSLKICVYPESEGKSFYAVGSSEFLPQLDQNHIQSIISEKNLKISTYQKSCTEVWLLIVSGAQFLSTMFNSKHDLNSKAFESDFKKVFLLDSFNKTFVELKITANNNDH